ncbi:MAG TPA: ribosome maturation factor RimM, partial [Myxococcaceae bacterium]|nr:ribosome maturation factor RimM [Myxococcaceae bacterium]
AEELTSARVLVFRADLEPPAEGEYFQGDLIGLTVVSEEGAPLGTVEEIWNNAPAPTLVIRRPGGEEILAPFADDFVREVDLERGRLVLRPPELIE